MTLHRMLDTSTTDETFATLQGFTITIDGYEYIAIENGRTYSFSTTSPSQIVQDGFLYSEHSVVQPMTIEYTIVVSKYDVTELSRLLKLRDDKKVFKLTNPVHNVEHCVITDININDGEYIDTLTLSVSFKEINSTIVTNPDTDVSFQMFGSLTLGCGSITASESSEVTTNATGNTILSTKSKDEINSVISGNDTEDTTVSNQSDESTYVSIHTQQYLT